MRIPPAPSHGAETIDPRRFDTRRLSRLLGALLHHAYNLGLSDEAYQPPEPFGELPAATLAHRSATGLAELCSGADLPADIRRGVTDELPCAIDWLAFVYSEAMRVRPEDPAAWILAAELLATIQQMQRALVDCGAEPAPAMLRGADGNRLQ